MPRVPFPALLLLPWSAFCAWCVSGFPPCIDLPAHGAQLAILAEVLRGGPASAAFEAHFSVGYGLTTWLFAPVALALSGEAAVKVAAWLTLSTFPASVAFLAQRLGRPWQLGLLAAPLGFSVSYWYGFLPTLFAGPLVLTVWAVWLRHVERPTRRSAGLVVALSLVVLLCHFIAFAALVVGALALTPRRSWRQLVLLGVPALVAAPRVLELVTTAARGAAALPTRYNLDAHLLGVVKQYPLGARISVWLNAVVIAAVGVAALVRWWRSRRNDPALWLAGSQALLFLAMPDDLAGSWRVGVRLVVFVAVAGLCTWPWARVPKALVALPLVALGCLAHLHVWFAREVDGLEAVIAAPPPPGVHGGLLVSGAAPPFTRLGLLEHQPQWWTARWGGLGTHLFADAPHQVVQWRAGAVRDERLRASTLEPAALDAVLVHGEGALPDALQSLTVVQTAGRWRRLERR
ncbi:MAG: hypothetical protein SFW67_36210 [Myxococcaceae bacterium]|nr:hypothetical protein [Myxococcaceae bacterium]